jgi:DNA-binding NtrC family response regulator
MEVRLLFIDLHEEWLDFIESTLSESYEIEVAKSIDILCEMRRSKRYFDLIFIGLSYVQDNIEKVSQLARSVDNHWHFVVLFPGFPDARNARVLYRAGVLDLQGKPYGAESLREMVEEELDLARRRIEARGRLEKEEDDYKSRVHRLSEYAQTITAANL